MANVKFIAVSRGLRGIVDYVTNREKTAEQLISGVNCVARTAVPEFEAVKKQFRKTEGRGYYHIVQAFAPDDPLGFTTAHELGVKLAEHFEGYQCIVVTHMNTAHIHNHIIMNSVSFETGMKFHQSAREMQQVKDYCSQLCREYGLSVTESKADPFRIPTWKRRLTDHIKEAKVICLIPGNDGHIYEMHKTEQGEFIAPKHKIIDFQAVAAGFTPALPLIPLSLMRQIIAFFRSFMAEHGQEYEALVLIYWDKWKEEYLAYVPKQNVSKAGIHASLQENPYDDESRYIHYADIHSHNSMEAFFSSIDDADERGTGIYMVLGHLDHFYPEIAARICCGGSFVDIDPGTVVEGLEEPFPPEWCTEVSHGKAPVSRVSPRKAEKTGIWGWKALDLLLGDLK